MNWANIFSKAKENHERSTTWAARGKVFMIGVIFAGAGGFGLYSDVTHHMHGKPATATLLEHLKQCTVEYQFIGEQERRKEQWPCEMAEEVLRLAGSKKIKVSHDYIARVRFQLEDGRTHEASVDDIKLGTHRLAVGTTLPVVYAPDNPSDVRAKMSWDRLKISLILLAIGTPFLMLAFGIPLSVLYGWAFRGRASRAGEETIPSEHLAPTLTRAPELGDGSKMQTRQSTVVMPRPIFGMRNR